MNESARTKAPVHLGQAAALLLAGVAGAAAAQSPAAAGPAGANEQGPYYVGARQGLTYESNATRAQSSGGGDNADTISSTTLLGGFDQRIGRQRVFGRADLSENRYFSRSRLNNTSYSVAAGLDGATVYDLTGGLDVGASRNLAEPIAFTPVGSTTPTTSRNVVSTQTIDARAAWGGLSYLSLDGSVGHSKVDYSSPLYLTSNLTQDRASVGMHFNPGSSLRLGVALRETRTRTPQAVPVAASGQFEANTATGKNIDFLVDYRLSEIVEAGGRLSQTRQTNSNPALAGADFSGVTGNLHVNYQATGKTSFGAFASRDVGFNSSLLNSSTATQVGLVTVVRPLTGLYQSNQVTNAFGLSVRYLATAKITANAGVRYARSRSLVSIASAGSSVAQPSTTDISKIAYIGADYAIARNWSVKCNVSYEKRDVTGAVSYPYSNESIGCAAQYTWR